MQKIIDKAWKYYHKSDSNGLLGAILNIKSEIETCTGKKIDVSKEIDKIESDVKKNGYRPPKDIFKKFKSLVRSKEKKRKEKTSSSNAPGILLDRTTCYEFSRV